LLYKCKAKTRSEGDTVADNNENRYALRSESENKQHIPIQSETSIYENICIHLASARTKSFNAINAAMVQVYWEIGREIAEAVGDRAEYGKRLLSFLSERLTTEFGKGFTVANLRNMRQFYHTFPIRYALRSELTWTHYRILMRVEDASHREFYLTECAASGWTSRQLERQINSFYYERLLATQKEHRDEVAGEIFALEPKNGAKYLLKDPYILEFLDLKENVKFNESELEQGLCGFLMKKLNRLMTIQQLALCL